MSIVKKLDSSAAVYAIENGEFSEEVLTSAKNVAIIMTQHWCPQWQAMQRWLYDLRDISDALIFEYIYNQDKHFEAFLALKEKKWQNPHIPYIRFYNNGILVNTTNYISKDEFLTMLSANPL